MSNWLRYPGSVSKRRNDHIRLLPIVSNSLAQCAQHDHTYRSLTKSDSSFSYFSTVMTIDNFTPMIALIFAGCISTRPKASGVTKMLAPMTRTYCKRRRYQACSPCGVSLLSSLSNKRISRATRRTLPHLHHQLVLHRRQGQSCWRLQPLLPSSP